MKHQSGRPISFNVEKCQTNDQTVISEVITDVSAHAETNQSENNSALLNETDHIEPDIVMSWTWDALKCAQENDKDMGCIIELMKQSTEQPSWQLIALKSQDTKTLWYQWPRLQIRDGVLRRRFEDIETKKERWQIILPCIFREEFLRIAHSGMTGGHLGRKKMESAIQQRAYWPSWSTDLKMYINVCKPCAQYHRGVIKHQAPMQSALVGEPWERISIDICGPFPVSSRSKRFILTIVDHFSKWAEAIPLSNHTAPTVGTPKQLLSDRGPEFESQLFSELMRCMEIDKLRCVAYKPSTNAIAERFHRTLNSMLGKVVSESQRDWDERLPTVLAAYRASVHSSTGFSPNRLFLGREIRMPLDLVMGTPQCENSAEQSTDQFVQSMRVDTERNYELAREQLRVAAERRKKNYDMKVRIAEFKVGEWVWYFYPRRFLHKTPKWQRMYTGPYLVVRVIEPVNYVLQKSVRAKPFVVHADKIKKCYGSTPDSWLTSDDVEKQATEEYPRKSETTIKETVVVEKANQPSVRRKHDRSYSKNTEYREVNVSLDDDDRDERIVKLRWRRENRKLPSHLKDYIL